MKAYLTSFIFLMHTHSVFCVFSIFPLFRSKDLVFFSFKLKIELLNHVKYCTHMHNEYRHSKSMYFFIFICSSLYYYYLGCDCWHSHGLVVFIAVCALAHYYLKL